MPLAEKWRSGKQTLRWLITGQAGTLFVCVTRLVLRGIRLVPRTCFSPQSRRGGSFDFSSRKENKLRTEDKSDQVCSSCGRKTKTLHQLYSFVSSALFSSENEKSESEARDGDSSAQFKRCLSTSVSSPNWIVLGRKNLETCTWQCSCVAQL